MRHTPGPHRAIRTGRPTRGSIPAAVATAVVAAAVVFSTSEIRAEIVVDAAFPTQGRPVHVTVRSADGVAAVGDTLTAVYRPSSEVSRTETIGVVGPDGRVAWTPLEAGVVTLTSMPPAGAAGRTPETLNLSVPFASTPLPGLAVLLIAGIILYGGVIRGFMKLGQPPAHLPPDT